MTALATDMTAVVNVLQTQNQVLQLLQKTIGQISKPLAAYEVAALPTTLAAYSLAWAINGRANASQGVGAGTGTIVIYNGTAWIASWSGVAVTA